MNSLLITGMLVLQWASVMRLQNSSDSTYVTIPSFFNKTVFEPSKAVNHAGLLYEDEPSALSSDKGMPPTVHYWNWRDTDKLPYYINIPDGGRQFVLPEGTDTLPEYKVGDRIVSDSIAGKGIKLGRELTAIFNSIVEPSWEDFRRDIVMPDAILLTPCEDCYVSGKAVLNDNFTSYILSSASGYRTTCYLINIDSGRLLSVAKLGHSESGIDASTEVNGYLDGNGAVILQEKFYGGTFTFGKDINDIIPDPEDTVNYYIYQISDDGTVRQLLPPGAAADEDKQP